MEVTVEASEKTRESKSLAGKLQWIKKLSLYEWVVIDLMILAVVGVAINHFAPAKSYSYWLVMVPVFGIACIVLEWSRARVRGKSGWAILHDQLLHWAGVLAAIYLIYLLRKTEQLSDTNSALVILLILALATYLAGIQLGWRLYIIGCFLGAVFLLSTFLIDFMWVLIVAGLALIGGYIYWRVQIKGRKGQPGQD
jgi:hypothetical protein